MDDQTKSFWWKFWGRPLRFFIWLTVISIFGLIGFGIYWQRLDFSPHFSPTSSFRAMLDVWGFAAMFVISLLALILSAIPWTRPAISWALRRWFFCVAVLVTLVALFYAEEDWRGKRAWEREKAHLEAMELSQNWEDYIPPAVPDDQNIFKAPKMQERFVRKLRSETNESVFSVPSTNRNTWSVGVATNTIVTEAQARDYIAWSDQLNPDFEIVRTALKRPYARMEGDYSQPAIVPIPNFVGVREMARVLGERAHCYYLLHQPDQALEQLTLMHDMRRMLEGAPSGKPMTLVAAMINVAVAGLYVDVVGEGFRLHAWQQPQLVALQKQLGDIKLVPFVSDAFRHEQVFSSTTFERSSRNVLIKLFSDSGSDRSWFQNRVALFLTYAPRGWFFQNMAVGASLTTRYFDRVDPINDSVSPSRQKEMTRSMETVLGRLSPYNFLVAINTPNFTRATQRLAYNQNQANMALIACALERYHLANNQYPESLAALTPQFVEKLPHDIINAGELKYRKTNDTFVLYSIGWNEKDDGGIPARVINSNGLMDLDNGDWVWPNSPK